MKVLLSNTTSFYEIEKSKFLGFSFIVKTKQECDEIIKEFKENYRDARHVCYAYVLNKDQSIQKYSDDGEPAGTAGFPMLSFLLKEELTNVLVIVVRYFGGVKLGAGGLLRSYVKATNLLFDSCNIGEYFETFDYEIVFSYEQIKNVNYWLNSNNLQVINKEYSDLINFKIQSRERLNKPEFIIELFEI